MLVNEGEELKAIGIYNEKTRHTILYNVDEITFDDLHKLFDGSGDVPVSTQR
jgi:hypothetical protein